MSEIDLIPAVYRSRRRLKSWVRSASTVVVIGTALAVGASMAFQWQRTQVEKDLRQLQVEKAISAQQRSQLESLNVRREGLTQQLDLLAGLRGGAAAIKMFETVDRAVSPGRVWFTDWKFRRAGTPTDVDPETVQTGYFIVVKDKTPASKEAWVIETEMKIEGEAIDHAALSEFVARLIDQPGIQDVRVVKTETYELLRRPLVRFSVDVVVGADDGGRG